MKIAILILLFTMFGLVVGFTLGKANYNFVNILPVSCTYNNRVYKKGESFKDDCNSCSCQNGQVACTLMACSTDTLNNDKTR